METKENERCYLYLKGIVLEDTLTKIDGEELSNIIHTVTKRHLCEVVRPKGEEFSVLCYLPGY
jgi:hypothetical protein